MRVSAVICAMCGALHGPDFFFLENKIHRSLWLVSSGQIMSGGGWGAVFGRVKVDL